LRGLHCSLGLSGDYCSDLERVGHVEEPGEKRRGEKFNRQDGLDRERRDVLFCVPRDCFLRVAVKGNLLIDV
jgi:hypothetical protein